MPKGHSSGSKCRSIPAMVPEPSVTTWSTGTRLGNNRAVPRHALSPPVEKPAPAQDAYQDGLPDDQERELGTDPQAEEGRRTLDGLTADQIAEKLNYSVHTVRKYVSTVHQILFARYRHQTFKKLTARDIKTESR